MPSVRSIVAPNLPAAPSQYDQKYQDQFGNILRLFFNQVTNSANAPRPYAAFYDTTTQTNPVANVARGMTLNSTTAAYAVRLGGPTSRIYVSEVGVYNIQFSAQVDKTGVGSDAMYIWLRVNGVNVPHSAGKVVISGFNAESVPAWNYVVNLQANDYIELMWSSPDTSMVLYATAAASPVPAIPSVIVTVTWASGLTL
jgi:hypothetical protein